jgi:hypothetical protein
MTGSSEATMRIDTVEWKRQRLRFKAPLVISIQHDETNQLVLAEDLSMNLRAFAYNEIELRQEVSEQILFMWNTYVESDEAALAKDARKLRDILQERLEKVEI